MGRMFEQLLGCYISTSNPNDPKAGQKKEQAPTRAEDSLTVARDLSENRILKQEKLQHLSSRETYELIVQQIDEVHQTQQARTLDESRKEEIIEELVSKCVSPGDMERLQQAVVNCCSDFPNLAGNGKANKFENLNLDKQS